MNIILNEEDEMDTTPKNDVIFKILFGNEKHPKFLIRLLNSIIKLQSPIVAVHIENTELNPDLVGDKCSRLDVLATTDQGEKINIEIQNKNEGNIIHRSLFYSTKVFSGQAVVGERYDELKRTICINILNFLLFEDNRFWHKHRIKDVETNAELTDLLEYHFFELPKSRKEINEESEVYFWLSFIDDPNSEKIQSMYTKEEVYREAKEAYDKALADPETRELIRLKEKGRMDFENAKKVSFEKGQAEGRAEERAKASKNALSLGLSIEQAAQISGLTIEEVKTLKQ